MSLTCKETPSSIQFKHEPVSILVNNGNSDEYLDRAPARNWYYGIYYDMYRFIFFGDKFQEKNHLRKFDLYVASTFSKSVLLITHSAQWEV